MFDNSTVWETGISEVCTHDVDCPWDVPVWFNMYHFMPSNAEDITPQAFDIIALELERKRQIGQAR